MSRICAAVTVGADLIRSSVISWLKVRAVRTSHSSSSALAAGAGGAGSGAAGYRYALTDLGRERARRLAW